MAHSLKIDILPAEVNAVFVSFVLELSSLKQNFSLYVEDSSFASVINQLMSELNFKTNISQNI